ncbi:thioredoxin family protein [Candidatus Bathyarchaeota archaeon]|nr:thioredoxin family protein [Candidatus Bathyarchaeota archaeon]
MSIKNIQWMDWEKEVLKVSEPVIVEFWHQNCPTCVKIEPLVKELPIKFDTMAKILRMNVLESKENRRLAIQKGVMGTPTFKIYCRGIEVGEIIGLEAVTELDQKLFKIINKCA